MWLRTSHTNRVDINSVEEWRRGEHTSLSHVAFSNSRGRKEFSFLPLLNVTELSLCKYLVIENTALQTQNLMFSIKASILEL